jgi:hypothetical protein
MYDPPAHTDIDCNDVENNRVMMKEFYEDLVLYQLTIRESHTKIINKWSERKVSREVHMAKVWCFV